MQVTLTYAGKRLNHKRKWVYAYETGGKIVHFDSRVRRFDILGDVIRCEREGDTFKPPFERIDQAPQDKITQWSIEQRADMQTKEAMNAMKIAPTGSVEQLIEAVKATCHTREQRKRMALYIFEKLLP